MRRFISVILDILEAGLLFGYGLFTVYLMGAVLLFGATGVYESNRLILYSEICLGFFTAAFAVFKLHRDLSDAVSGGKGKGGAK